MSKSYVSPKVKIEVAARAGGRCELCGAFCYEDLYHFETNIAENAHMIADSPEGPRGIKFYPLEKGGETAENLMFLCSNCHTVIDSNPDTYTLESLKMIKREHERKVFESYKFSIDPIAFIKYTSPTENNDVTIPDSIIKKINFNEYISINSIFLDLSNKIQYDEKSSYETYIKNRADDLEKIYNQNYSKFNLNDISRFYIFGIAPIPLLIKLGTLFNEKNAISIREKSRSTDWSWKDKNNNLHFKILEPKTIDKNLQFLMLKISISSPLDDLVDQNFWTITVDEPAMDIINNEKDIINFGTCFKDFFEKISKYYSKDIPIHVYSAIPPSIAIKMGASYLKNAHNKLIIYNRVNKKFVKALEIN